MAEIQKYIRVGDTLTNILDSKTGEAVTYDKVLLYGDGTAMDDTKVDPAIYRKLGTEYFKRNYTGAISSAWFGINNTGLVDNTSDFNKLLKVASVTGSRIQVEQGIYNISNVSLYNNTNLFGNGSVLINCVTDDGFIGSNIKNVYLGNIQLKGITGTSEAKNIYLTNACENVTIDGVKFLGGKNGVYAVDVKNYRLINCNGSDYELWPNFLEGAENVVIDSNIFYNCLDGIKLGGVQVPETMKTHKNIIVSNNTCYGNVRDGLDIASNIIDGLIITGNMFRDNTLQGVDCKLIYQTGYADNISINNNVFSKNLSIGINFQCEEEVESSLFKATINNNTIYGGYGLTVDTTYGIRVSGATSGFIHDNIVQNVHEGLRITGGSNLSIRRNNLTCISAGINITSILAGTVSDNNTIEQNVISGSTRAIVLGLSAGDLGSINNTIIKNNRYSTSTAQVPLSDVKSTNTRSYGNVIGETSLTTESSLTFPSTVGDIYMSFNPVTLGYTGFISTASGVYKKFGKLFEDEYTTKYLLQTTDNVLTTKLTIATTANTISSRTIDILVRNAAGACAHYKKIQTISNDSGVARVVALQDIVADTKEAGISTVDITIDVTAGSFRLRLKGVTGETLNWQVLITNNS